ncbi:LysR family transcriptional regulator [Aquimarina sp. TRL1]|uniref:winged helix-turn-helix domain-containing protein n=1 Tax=Aquimarina sp. (strain TRL1) TaxID=2736252 RepID=UPI00158C70AF|nr:winged helix-turn-helix domain-containing protein [Aquimarina sp. TRL1]QKX04023.1 LysR family transcriptional regulator [Aquimarina sp. TRL1]
MKNVKIKSRIWIEVDDNVLIGEGRVRLLKAIENTGSLSKAAKKLNMSYKKAWDLIYSMNNATSCPVITTTIGGKNGGGAVLTEHGKTLIDFFEELNKGCWEYLDRQKGEIRIR